MTEEQGMLSHSAGLLRKIGAQKTTLDYRHRQSVFEHGDAADALFYIDRGNVKLTVVSQTGKKAIIAILRRGEFFGESCLVKNTLRTSTATENFWKIRFVTAMKEPQRRPQKFIALLVRKNCIR